MVKRSSRKDGVEWLIKKSEALMGDKTGIGWTRGEDGTEGATWNPFRVYVRQPDASYRAQGWFCEKVGPGCEYCYAEALNVFRGNGLAYTDKIDFGSAGTYQLQIDHAMMLAPLRWTRGRKIFPCSMTDYCLRHYPEDWIHAMIGVALLSPQHTFQFLTKRADRQTQILNALFDGNEWAVSAGKRICINALRRLVPEVETILHRRGQRTHPFSWSDELDEKLPLNIWTGVSIETEEYLWRAEKLRKCVMPVRWWSIEPFIDRYSETMRMSVRELLSDRSVSWAVLGGESGRSARAFDIASARRIINDFAIAKIPLFVKQVGANPTWPKPMPNQPKPVIVHQTTGKGDNPEEWPEYLRVQQFPVL